MYFRFLILSPSSRSTCSPGGLGTFVGRHLATAGNQLLDEDFAILSGKGERLFQKFQNLRHRLCPDFLWCADLHSAASTTPEAPDSIALFAKAWEMRMRGTKSPCH
jgi:hypothetical protein